MREKGFVVSLREVIAMAVAVAIFVALASWFLTPTWFLTRKIGKETEWIRSQSEERASLVLFSDRQAQRVFQNFKNMGKSRLCDLLKCFHEVTRNYFFSSKDYSVLAKIQEQEEDSWRSSESAELFHALTEWEVVVDRKLSSMLSNPDTVRAVYQLHWVSLKMHLAGMSADRRNALLNDAQSVIDSFSLACKPETPAGDYDTLSFNLFSEFLAGCPLVGKCRIKNRPEEPKKLIAVYQEILDDLRR